MSRLIAIMVLLATVSGCKKSKPEPYKTPVYQQFDNGFLTHFKSFRLFTQSGEITSMQLRQAYRTEWSDFFYDANSTFSALEFRRFSFVNNDSIISVSTVPAFQLKRTVIDEYDKFVSGHSIPVNDTNNLILHISKYKTYQAKTTPLNYTYFDVESPVYFLKKVNDTLFFPMVKYVTISRTDHSVSFSSDKFNNVFSEAGVKKLGPTDTLLIQSFDLGLRKVKE